MQKNSNNVVSRKSVVVLAILSLSLTAQSCASGSGPKGVWKSTDAGRNWEQVNLVEREGRRRPQADLNSVDVRHLAGPPDNPDIIYAATGSGVFATDNTGQVWHRVLAEIDAQVVAVANADPNIVYAAGNVDGRGAVYKSTDRGLNWERKYIEAAENPAWSLAVNFSDANDVAVGFNSGLMLRSRSGGETWSVVNTFPSRVQQLSFHPNDPRIIYILVRASGLMVTRDGGASFSSITSSLTSRGGNLDILAFQQRGFIAPRAFIGFDFPLSQPNTVFITTDVGLFRSDDFGVNWNELKLPVDPTHAETIAVDVAGGPDRLYVSIDTVLYRSADGGQTFNTQKLPTSRLIRTIQTPADNPETVYVGLISI